VAQLRERQVDRFERVRSMNNSVESTATTAVRVDSKAALLTDHSTD
jgi:uncharacterized protein (DUF1786 family)